MDLVVGENKNLRQVEIHDVRDFADGIQFVLVGVQTWLILEKPCIHLYTLINHPVVRRLFSDFRNRSSGL